METENQYSKIDAKIYISSRLLSDDEAQSSQSRMAGLETLKREFPTPPVVKDPTLNEYLGLLNAKLDALLEKSAGETKTSSAMRSRPINISAGEILFPSDIEYKIGNKIEIQMVLPTKKPISLTVIGQVIKANRALTTARFINIEEEIRQKIADFVFYREREILMSEKNVS